MGKGEREREIVILMIFFFSRERIWFNIEEGAVSVLIMYKVEFFSFFENFQVSSRTVGEWSRNRETTFIMATRRKGNMENGRLRGKLANVSGRRNELSLRIQLFEQFSWATPPWKGSLLPFIPFYLITNVARTLMRSFSWLEISCWRILISKGIILARNFSLNGKDE